MSETRIFKLTKRVSFSLVCIWEYNEESVCSFSFIPCISFKRFGSAFEEWRDTFPRCAIQFNWLYILFSIKIFIIGKLKDK